MGGNPNSLSIKSIWSNVYQISHLMQPVYKAFATERLATQLKVGNTIYRTYSSDVIVNEMGGDGSYSTQGLTDTDESLTVDQNQKYLFKFLTGRLFRLTCLLKDKQLKRLCLDFGIILMESV